MFSDRLRKSSIQERFERSKTPMGAVPISVIMGFDYPLGAGCTDSASVSSYTSPSYSSVSSRYRDINMLERLPRPSYASFNSVTDGRQCYRAKTEV